MSMSSEICRSWGVSMEKSSVSVFLASIIVDFNVTVGMVKYALKLPVATSFSLKSSLMFYITMA